MVIGRQETTICKQTILRLNEMTNNNIMKLAEKVRVIFFTSTGVNP